MFTQYIHKIWDDESWASHLGFEVKEIYTKKALQRFVLRTKFDRRWLEIRKRMKISDSILDAGCGMGHWVWFLNQKGFRASGLDYSQQLVGILKKQMPQYSWIQGAIQAIPFENNSFEGVISWGVIEHDETGPKAALREFFRILKPGGYMFITTPLDTPARRKSSWVLFPYTEQNGFFFQYFFTELELIELISQVGFKVEATFKLITSYAIIFPNLYNRMKNKNYIHRKLLHYVMMPLVYFSPHRYSMVLVAAKKYQY